MIFCLLLQAVFLFQVVLSADHGDRLAELLQIETAKIDLRHWQLDVKFRVALPLGTSLIGRIDAVVAFRGLDVQQIVVPESFD